MDNIDDKTQSGPGDKPSHQQVTDPGDFRRVEHRTLKKGTRIAQYLILDTLGEGGMGVVYLAEQQEPIKRKVALKLVRAGKWMATELHHRFELERQILARLNHPNIAQVFQAGNTEEGFPFIAMEFVQGEPITEYADRHRLGLKERILLVIATCHGLQHAHQKGVIHRDLKPSNVLVTQVDGRPVPKVIDFGIAKLLHSDIEDFAGLTADGRVLGTPAYLSPESIHSAGPNSDIDTRSDVYAMGILLCELFVGRRPFVREGGSLLQLLTEITEKGATPPAELFGKFDQLEASQIASNRSTQPHSLLKNLQGDLNWIVLKCLHEDRNLRYDTAVALADDLKHYLAYEPVLASPPGRGYRFGKFLRRHRGGVFASFLVAVALIGGIVTTTFQAKNARQAQAETEEVVDFMVRLFNVSDPSEARGREVKALEILNQGAERVKEELADQPHTRIRILNTIGKVYGNLRLYQESSDLLQEASELERSLNGNSSPGLALSLYELAEANCNLGNFTQCENELRSSLKIREDRLGRDHHLVAQTLNRLGIWTQTQGRSEEALPMLQRALEIFERDFGPEDPRVASTLAHLGVVQVERGHYQEAEEMYRRAHAIRLKTLGDDHPETISSLNDIAISIAQQGDLEGSLPLFRDVVTLRKKIFHNDHPSTAQALNNLASALEQFGQVDEAEIHLKRSAEIYKKALGDQHPRFAIALVNLGSCALKREALDQAEAYFLRSKTIIADAYDEEHPHYATVLFLLGQVHLQREEFAEARRNLEDSLKLRKKIFPAGHGEIQKVVDELRAALQGLGLTSEAEALPVPRLLNTTESNARDTSH